MKSSIFVLAYLFCFQISTSAQNIWVLSDNDLNYETPPTNDELQVFAPDGTYLATVSGFNMDLSICSRRLLSVSPDDQSCWVSEHLGNPAHLAKVDIQGNILLEIPGQWGSIDIRSDGVIYALPGETTSGDNIFMLDDQGNVLDSVLYGGIDIVVDEIHNSVWVVGAQVKRYNLNLEEQFIIDPIAWTAASVDYASDGSAWIAEMASQYVEGSLNRMIHVDASGNILNIIDLDERPYCLRVNREDGSVWTVTKNHIYRYIPDQSQLIAAGDVLFGWSISIDRGNNLIWVSDISGVYSYLPDGTLQTSITQVNNGDKWIAVRKVILVDVDSDHSDTPANFRLSQNYPNPFNPSTQIKYSLAEASFVELTVFDLLGEEIDVMVNEFKEAGNYNVTFDSKNNPAGVYFYRLRAGKNIEHKKMVLLR